MRVRNIKNLLDANDYFFEESKRGKHLEAAFHVANAVRSIIGQSATHPSANELGEEEFDSLSERIDAMRTEIEKLCYKIHDQDKQHKILTVWSNIIEKEHIGDCPEYSMLALKKLQEMYPDLKGEVFVIEKKNTNNDEDAHEILVIGRDPKSPFHDFARWGSDAVICDAWLGEVYSARQIPNKLKCARADLSTGRQINSVADFKTSIHILKCDFSLPDAQIGEKRKEMVSVPGTFFAINNNSKNELADLNSVDTETKTEDLEAEPSNKRPKANPHD